MDPKQLASKLPASQSMWMITRSVGAPAYRLEHWQDQYGPSLVESPVRITAASAATGSSDLASATWQPVHAATEQTFDALVDQRAVPFDIAVHPYNPAHVYVSFSSPACVRAFGPDVGRCFQSPDLEGPSLLWADGATSQLYVCDQVGRAIATFTLSLQPVARSIGTVGVAQLQSPSGLTADNAPAETGFIYVSDRDKRCIFVFRKKDLSLHRLIAGDFLNSPSSIIVDPAGSHLIFVSDIDHRLEPCIRILRYDGAQMGVIAHPSTKMVQKSASAENGLKGKTEGDAALVPRKLSLYLQPTNGSGRRQLAVYWTDYARGRVHVFT